MRARKYLTNRKKKYLTITSNNDKCSELFFVKWTTIWQMRL